MKYISLQKYDQEFSGQGIKHKLFYNPNDTVAIFEDGFDEEIWAYILEKGRALKDSGFIMNRENEGIIRQYVKDERLKNEAAAVSPKETLTGKTIYSGEAKLATPILPQQKLENWIFELESKPTVAKLALVLKEVLEEFENCLSRK